MIDVVVDTNIFISSLYGGTPKKVIDLWKAGSINLCISRSIIDEYIEVLGRMGLRDEQETAELLRLFSQGFHLRYCAKTPSLRIVQPDPDDDKFIECAVALRAQYIVSGDKALLGVVQYMGIRIVTPREFLSLVQG